MKKIKFLSFSIIAMFVLLSCEQVDFNPGSEITPGTNGSSIMLKSSAGFNSAVGVIYVQQGIGTGLKVQSLDVTKQIKSAAWKVNEQDYNGLEIFHKFLTLGSASLTVVVTYQNGTTETRTFTIVVVTDISEFDPVRYFITANTNGTWNVLLLFSKERIKSATDSILYYNGNVSGWEKKLISDSEKHYVINAEGKPVKTNDVGKYAGVSLTLSTSGIYSIALVHSVSVWADLSGSAFIKQDNVGLAWFTFDKGVVIPNGDMTPILNLPAIIGDDYFRYEQIGDVRGKTIVYFKLDGNYTNTAFFVRELEGGTYSAPLLLSPVTSFPEWGKYELNTSDLVGKVSGFRYGPNINYPTTYSTNMNKCFFWDNYFKNIRVSLFNL